MSALKCFTCVCLFVSMSARLLKSYKQILVKFFGAVEGGPRNKRLDLGGNVRHDSDLGIFKEFFIYRCDTCTQPRSKSENPQRTFDLSAF